ncbi:MAG: molybdopterin oxidoreductase family protein [Myxococcales bacterium]|nr:molybdopterin oxidoreductase family protein [Myxococcales bacterium]
MQGYASCSLCEASCGLVVEHDGREVQSIRGDSRNPFSKGYLCPKAMGLKDIHEDPNRVRFPMKRVGGRLMRTTWDDALNLVARRFAEIQRRHGKDSVGMYAGNPLGHSYAGTLGFVLLHAVLGSKNRYSSQSVDALPRLFTTYHLYGNQALLPVPDLERTDYLLMLGANPMVSNGSIMTAPGFKQRIRDLRGRGAKLVVVDPRRTETAKEADEHVFIRPGSDAFLLLGMLAAIFEAGLEKPGRLAEFTSGLEELKSVALRFPPERVSPACGISSEKIRQLAKDFAGAQRAACYGRMGTSTQRFGALASWLFEALNVVTGNLDREGGMMFNTPAVDLAKLAAMIGLRGSYASFRTRVRGLPEFAKELPSAAFAEEMDTAGPGRIRGLITVAGNPALSLPNGPRVERALEKLDFMVSVDIYVNETSRHADVILPTTFGLERENYPLLSSSMAVRNHAHYSSALLTPKGELKSDWDVLTKLSAKLLEARGGGARVVSAALQAFIATLKPRQILSLLLRFGPHKLQLSDLGEHGIDLGPLEPRLPAALQTPSGRIELAPSGLVADVARLEQALSEGIGRERPFSLIGRRNLRSNNSWMHNSERLVKGRERCTLIVHPEDAGKLGLASGSKARVTSRVGSIEVPVEISDELMPGVVSLPHGYGHHREGAQLDVAERYAGVSINDVTDEQLIDELAGTSHLNGVPVSLEAI